MELWKQDQALRRQLGEEIRQSDDFKRLAAEKGAARQAFAAAVAANWPFEADGDTLKTLAEASKALEEGRELHQAYREGKGTRDEVLTKWIALADHFPGTIEHDEALFMVGMLYLQHLRPEMKMDIPAARRIFERLVKRSGPPSQRTLELCPSSCVLFLPGPE